MSTPLGDELAKAARIVLNNRTSSEDLAPARVRERDALVRALARYEMAQEMAQETPVTELDVAAGPLPRDKDLIGLLKAATRAAPFVKSIHGGGYLAEELLWSVDEVEKKLAPQ